MFFKKESILHEIMQVLFVCHANINRSQIAEAIFNRLSKSDFAISAGLLAVIGPLSNEKNNPLLPMNNLGFDLSKARAKALDQQMVESSGKVVVILNKEKYEKFIPDYLRQATGLEFWDIDAIGGDTPFDEYCVLEEKRIKKVESKVKELLQRLDS